jgi:adenosylcobyric acid synthase
VASVKELKNPDLVILPGTKNTMGDLKWLRECGLEAAILKYAAAGKPIIGICGGYQMLCKKLCDPCRVEEGGEMIGLGLIDADTVFEEQKVRTRVKGSFLKMEGVFKDLSCVKFEGYEIHMGRTQGTSNSLSQLTDMQGVTKPDGMANGNVFGSYVHGIFDSDGVLKAIAQALLKEKGLDGGNIRLPAFDINTYKQKQYDILADTMRKSLDMELVYKILEEGI